MNTPPDGGPAFPVPIQKVSHDTRPEHFRETNTQGMSLRDWFAGQALAGFIANPTIGENLDSQETAEAAYHQADAMLAAREKGTK